MTGIPSRAPALTQTVWLVAEREITAKLRSKAFLVSTALLLVLALGGIIWGGLAAAHPSQTSVAVTAATEQTVAHVSTIDATVADSPDAAIALVKDGTVDAALVPDATSPVHVKIVADRSAPDTLVAALTVTPPVQLLTPDSQDSLLRYFVAIGFGIVFLMSATLFGSTIAQSVVEEKQTRVVEILVSTIPVRALMAGKILGNTILAMAQILALVAVAVIGLSVTGQGVVLSGLGAPLVWFAVFFLFGFILLAALFSAAAALVSRQEDIGSTTTPLTMLIVLPYVLVITFNDNPVVMAVLSYVPFSAPVGMPLRLFLGGVAWWEPLLALALLIVTCVGAILVGAKIYRNSLLRTGARVKLVDALRG